MNFENARLISFISVFAVMAAAEWFWPRRVLTVPKQQRWFCNIAIVVLSTLIARIVMPLMPLGVAVIAQAKGWGLFNLAGWHGWPEQLAGMLLLDLAIYLQHRAFHRVPLFWRFHRMHHSDLELDVSSGNRFHPIEIIVSLVIKAAVVMIMGISPLALVLFEIVLNATSLFNHANLYLPVAVDRRLRWFLVTPDMHRVHHSVIPRETDSNFSFNLPWWDRMFRTYTDQPSRGHDGMTIGLREYRDQAGLGLWRLLRMPFE